ncbi:LOW QUALITY PROTEIN: ankyrin repeat domain-containing protein SOWAHB [Engraulis encrasicolus]|uniref:LOW QUALITY PROTEIN: ankyrin repeat domain-containing protein SOWAHB n=1 Tax=Engraulis encrasicolus TaxID=184585 RepID=UPI002FD180AF
MAITQETILNFLLEQGGKVKNAELLSKFKEALSCSDPVEKKQNRDLFKSCVNNIAVVKVIDEVKYVVVKKKYQGLARSSSIIAPKNEFEDSLSRFSSSVLSSSPERSSAFKHGTDKTKCAKSVIENNNNSYFTSNNNELVRGCNTDDDLRNEPASKGCCNSDYKPQQMSSRNENSSVLKDTKPRKTGAVFAIIAVKSPPDSPSHHQQEQFHSGGLAQEPASPQHLQAIRITHLSKSDSSPRHQKPDNESDKDDSPETKRRQLETKVVHPAPQQHAAQLKSFNKTSKASHETKCSEGVPLELAEHEWLVKSAAGHWDQVYGLLLQDAQLADKRDFVSGFSALHWAAKAGHKDMVRKILDLSADRGVEVDVNARTHAGYTPLHIAAIHGRSSVMTLLVRDYCADTSVRDHSGKKPFHYLEQRTSLELRQLLGDPHAGQQQQQQEGIMAGDKSEDEHQQHTFPDLHKGFNTFSKLFQPHLGGHRKKHRRHRPSFHTLSVGPEEEKGGRTRETSAGNTTTTTTSPADSQRCSTDTCSTLLDWAHTEQIS